MITIGISKLNVDCIIGCFPEERCHRRTLICDIKLKVSFQNEDALKATVDYGKVTELVIRICQSREFHLLETLASVVATEILKEFSAVQELFVCIRKPNALSVCEDAFVEIQRRREEL